MGCRFQNALLERDISAVSPPWSNIGKTQVNISYRESDGKSEMRNQGDTLYTYMKKKKNTYKYIQIHINSILG